MSVVLIVAIGYVLSPMIALLAIAITVLVAGIWGTK